MENKNRFIKIKFEKPNNQIELNKNKTINILFFFRFLDKSNATPLLLLLLADVDMFRLLLFVF